MNTLNEDNPINFSECLLSISVEEHKTIINKYFIWFSIHFPFASHDITPFTDI